MKENVEFECYKIKQIIIETHLNLEHPEGTTMDSDKNDTIRSF